MTDRERVTNNGEKIIERKRERNEKNKQTDNIRANKQLQVESARAKTRN